jgi:hypothetical protein
MTRMSAQRIYAAVWFMVAGAVPGVCIISYDLIQNRQLRTSPLFLLVLYEIIPALLAAVSGAFLGGDILNEEKINNAGHAAVRGFFVSLVAWLVYVPVLSILAGRDWNMGFAYKVFLVLIFGSILVGWLIAAVGIVTALLLFRMRNFCPAK